MDIVTIGEAMACLVPETTGPLRHVRLFDKHVAGAEMNLAIGAARLGLATGWISRVGQDEFGTEILRTLRGEGVDVSRVRASQRPTGVYFKEYTALGEPNVYYYRAGSAASEMGPEDIDPDYIAGARVLHVTGITPLLSESCHRAILKAMETAKAAGVKVSFDPNIRYKLVRPADVPAVFQPLVQMSDLVLAGEPELRAIFDLPSASLEELELRTLDEGPSLVVVKRGADGASARTRKERVEEAARPVEQVIDPIGAGDGFDAGFLAGWLRDWDLRLSLRLANLMGASATGVKGDYEGYPALSDALAALGNRLEAGR